MRAAVGSHNPRFELGPVASRLVIDALAISQIIESRGVPSLLDYFTGMPPGRAWTEPGPYLVLAAVALPEGRPEPCAVALNAADGIMEAVPADQQIEGRLAAAMIRLAVCVRTGDLEAAAAVTVRADCHRYA